LETISIETDLRGRIRNTELARNRPLLPVYEAVVNSIIAIDELGGAVSTEKIVVKVIRDHSQQELDLEGSPRVLPRVMDFEITDTGVGFNEPNFQSFCRADTTYREHKGGKGVGRFLWLVAFERVEIESVFEEDGKKFFRKMSFDVDNEITVEKREATEHEARETTVRLIGFKPKYREEIVLGEKISARIMEHCLSYFLSGAAPQILVVDDSVTNLNEQFERDVLDQSVENEVDILGVRFSIHHMKLRSHGGNDHLLHLCAHNRDVNHISIDKFAPDVKEKLFDANDRTFVYAGYVFSDYLDEHVSRGRTRFNFDKKRGGTRDWHEPVTQEDIVAALAPHVIEYLRVFLEPIKKKKEEGIRRYIENEGVQYRPLLRYEPEFVDRIRPGLDDGELDDELHKIYREFEDGVRSKATALTSGTIDDEDDYRCCFSEVFEMTNEVVQSSLAAYVIRRKLVLEFLSMALAIKDDGKYRNEEAVHEIIFPMRFTSDDVEYEAHNLWVIDEKLVYHSYLASDKRFDKMEPVDVDSQKRPDIVVFNRPHSFSDDERGSTYCDVVLVEFKKPGKTGYTLDDNPIEQVLNYWELIKQGKAMDDDGRPLVVREGAPAYCYVVCDLNEKLERIAGRYELTARPEGDGYFGYKATDRAYLDVISYNKLVVDANRKNRVFFEKLGISKVRIPTRDTGKPEGAGENAEKVDEMVQEE
jgi:hypothetical protein